MKRTRSNQVADAREDRVATGASWTDADAEQHAVKEQVAKLEALRGVLEEGEQSGFSDRYSVDRVLAKVDRATK
jgi:hypothetical protein